MAKKCNKLVNKIILQMLTFLGIGSASFLFMACYGPMPREYRVDADTLDSLSVDSIYDVEADPLNEADVQKPE